METMKEVTRYQCKFCKKDFKTPDRHYCKFNPELKNCFTCKNLKEWSEGDRYDFQSNYPDCTKGYDDYDGSWTIESIKQVHYNMQCNAWEEGKYDWSKEDK